MPYLFQFQQESHFSTTDQAAFRARLDTFLADIARFKIAALSEGRTDDEWIRQMKAAAGE